MNRGPDINEVFSALADPTRRRIVEMLSAGETMTLSGIACHFDLSRQAVTKHLEVLRDAGLVTCDRRGRERLNRIDPGALRPLASWTRRYASFWEDRLERLKRNVERRRSGK